MTPEYHRTKAESDYAYFGHCSVSRALTLDYSVYHIDIEDSLKKTQKITEKHRDPESTPTIWNPD